MSALIHDGVSRLAELDNGILKLQLRLTAAIFLNH